MASYSARPSFATLVVVATALLSLSQSTLVSASQCYCDDLCTSYNDCCPGCPPESPNPSPSPDTPPKMCVGNCFSDFVQGDPCQCDSQCVSFGDCCPDFSSVCQCPGGGDCTGGLCQKMVEECPELCYINPAQASAELLLQSEIFHLACPGECGNCN